MREENLETLISGNTDIFRRELTEVIKPSFDGLENPLAYTQLLKEKIGKSKRSSLLKQAEVETAAIEYLSSKKNKSLILSAEMGSGKCILPESNVIIDGQVYTIEEAYNKFADKESVVVDDKNPFAFWYKTKNTLCVPSYSEQERTIVEKKISRFYKQKVSETIREVKTAGKYRLKTTQVHKFLTPEGWTNNINVGDYVAIPKNEKIIGEKQNIMNPQLLAWILGEGYFGCLNVRLDGKDSGHHISVTQKSTDIADKIYDMAIAESKYSVTKRVDKRNKMNEIGIYKVQNLLQYIKWGVSKDKEIPDFLMKSTKIDIVKFLAAYIDAEGSISKCAKGTVEISTASKKMAYQLSSLLRKLNVVSSIEEMRRCATNGTKIKRTYYRVSISGSSARTLSKLIVPHSIVDYKKERLLNISKRVINNNIETIYMFDIIKQLRELTGLSRAKSNNIFANVYLNGIQKTVNIKRAHEIIELIDSVIDGSLEISQDIQIKKLNIIKDEVLLRISQEIFFVPVKEINEYQYDGYVYDLSIEDTHNFIAENMLVHNTSMAVNISLSDKLCPVYMIVCPPHLVDTWKEELETVYRDPKAYKVVRVKRYEDIAPYAKRNLWKDGVKYYFIITRENLKLSYPKEVAVSIKKRYVSKEKRLDGQTLMFKTLINVAKCPECDVALQEGDEDSVSLKKIPRKCECGCVLRQPDRSRSKSLRTRESIADYVFKNFSKGSYNVILDEMHEYKGGDTGQGNAMGRLVSGARKTIGLTGTLMNGYASSLFYLLYRLNPRLMKNELGFDYNQVKNFVSAYGAHEEIVDAKEVSTEGIVTKMGARIKLKEKAKISPHMLSILMGMTIFLKLEEIKMPNNLQLPPYEEIVDLVEMEKELKYPYLNYLGGLTKLIRTNRSLLGRLATDAIAIPDMPFDHKFAEAGCEYKPKYTREEFGLTNKEKRLIENVRGEMEAGRDCLVYLTFSNQTVATDLQDILTEAFPEKTVKFLPSSVLPAKRKEWIKNNPSDVLICNPELVKTGLTLLNFVTIIFYETTYNVFTLKQASRRSWRIGQTEDIKVIFMAYADTPQHKALELIGAKIGAANSLEGKFSGDDDLSSMGDDDDNIQLALAKSIIGEETASRDIEMTSIQNFGGDREFNSFEKYYQLLLDENKHLEKLEEEQKTLQAETADTVSKEEIAEFSNENPSCLDVCLESKEEISGLKANNAFSLENMITVFAENLLEHHISGDLYGGVKTSIKLGHSKKEDVSTHVSMAYQLFKMNNDYKNGKQFGLAVSYERHDDYQIANVHVNKVYFENDVPYNKEETVIHFSKNVLASVLESGNNNVSTLAKVLKSHFDAKSITDKTLLRVIEQEQDEEDSTSLFYYVGKGKKQKRVEVKSANNLLDEIPDSHKETGVQLAFAF